MSKYYSLTALMLGSSCCSHLATRSPFSKLRFHRFWARVFR